jgi:outer membrane protein assembly factor BamB
MGRLLVAVLAYGSVACDASGAGDPAVAITPTAVAAPARLTTPDPANLPPGAGDWPMYGHDASRTGYNPAETLLAPQTVEQLAARWQANVGIGPAPSSSAPSVADGQVYLGSSVPGGPNFFAFDAGSGAPIWQADLGHTAGCYNVGIGATAAISSNVVVAGSGDQNYYGLDPATGAVLWTSPLNAGPSGFGWASAAIANGRAYLGVASGCDNPSVRGEVRAVDLASGQTLASQFFVPDGVAGAGIWNSPAVTPDGTMLAVATGEDDDGYDGPYNRAMVSLDALTLTIHQANQQGATDQDLDYATTPIIFHDSQGRTLVAANHKDDSFYVYDLNRLDAGPLWQQHTGSVIGLPPAYDPNFGAGGTLFYIDGLGQLFAVDPATGAPRWPAAKLGAAHGNIALAGGLVFANLGADGLLIVDETTGQPLRTLHPANAGPAYSGVAVAHGFVYWMSGAYLNAWSVP